MNLAGQLCPGLEPVTQDPVTQDQVTQDQVTQYSVLGL